MLSLIQGTYTTPTQPAVGLSFLCILLDITLSMWNIECANEEAIIKLKYFYDGSFKYQNIDRIGGVLSHLRKVHRREMIEQLGEQHSQIFSSTAPNAGADRHDDICMYCLCL